MTAACPAAPRLLSTARCPAVGRVNIPPDALDNGKSKVLVVDDDPEIVELFVDVLNRDGRFEVRTAGTGYDAGMVTTEFQPDLIILDYMLPDVNGNVVCRSIRT